MANPVRASNYLIGSGALAIAAIMLMGAAISQRKPMRGLSALLPLVAAVSAAVVARKGQIPAETETIDRAAQISVREAEVTNLLEEVAFADDMERELRFRRREIEVEAKELEELGPLHVQIQAMRRDLGLDPIYPIAGVPMGFNMPPLLPQQPTVEATTQAPQTEARAQSAKRDAIDDMAEHRGHLVISSRTQSGKTSTILGAVDRKMAKQGYANFTIVDPKKTYWMGLEELRRPNGKSRLVDLDLNRPGDSEKLLQTLQWAQSLQVQRQRERLECRKAGRDYNPPEEIIAIDEWPACLAMARRHDSAQKALAKEAGEAYQSTEAQIIELVEMLLFTSAEDRIYIWILAQSHRCNVLGITDGLRTNMAVWAQGRLDEMQSIEAALGDNWLIPQTDTRKTLVSQFLMERQKQGSAPIFYTNLGGHKLGRVPDLSHIKTKRVFSPVQDNQTDRASLDRLLDITPEEFPDDEQ